MEELEEIAGEGFEGRWLNPFPGWTHCKRHEINQANHPRLLMNRIYQGRVNKIQIFDPDKPAKSPDRWKDS